jgi:rod shape-determining protein MreC
MINNVTELSTLRTENEELRTRLDQALANKNACDIAIAENKKLNKELNIINAQPRDTIIADIVQNNTVLGHNTYIVNRGNQDGIKKGMAVTNTDMTLVGIIIDVADNFSRVRALTDADINIAVRIVGSDVYGFMTGNGSKRPDIGLFSDPEFQPANGLKLVTSNISGIMPQGIYVGELIDETDVKITPPSKLSRVMVLKFDTQQNEYK